MGVLGVGLNGSFSVGLGIAYLPWQIRWEVEAPKGLFLLLFFFFWSAFYR